MKLSELLAAKYKDDETTEHLHLIYLAQDLETALAEAQGLVKEAMWLLHIAEGYAESEIDDWEERAKTALKEATQ